MTGGASTLEPHLSTRAEINLQWTQGLSEGLNTTGGNFKTGIGMVFWKRLQTQKQPQKLHPKPASVSV